MKKVHAVKEKKKGRTDELLKGSEAKDRAVLDWSFEKDGVELTP